MATTINELNDIVAEAYAYGAAGANRVTTLTRLAQRIHEVYGNADKQARAEERVQAFFELDQLKEVV